MQRIRTRLSQYADVRAAVVALCSVVLRGVDGDLLNGIRGRSGKSLANRAIHRCAGLDGAPGTEVLTGVEYEAVLTYLAGEIAVKEVVCADTVQGKAIAGVPVSVSEDGLIAEACVGAPSTEEVRMNARAKNRELREAAGAQWGRFDGLGIDDIADRGVHLVHQGHSVHFHRGADRAHHQRRIYCRRTVTGHQDFRVCFRFEAVFRDGD